ncbi:MAG TPA: sigma-70 family RNA polymerase sigma factor [Gemmataceae bacterium]|jgi:RNA polymerase sigma-70 factor (ECF subfamily)|nr:sigma-70 family RNA polymerase sigma factor [Gemmataceae bacterium]
MAKEQEQSRKAEFAEYLRQHQARLYGYIHSLVRDLNDADDLFQQTTLILWKKFGEFDRRRSFFAWACGIARLEVANFLRSRGRQRLYFSDDLNLLLIEAQDEMTDAELEDRRDALARCVEKLRQRDRELLTECYGDPAGVHRAADRRGRSPQSVYNSLRRIRRALFECIARTLAQESRPEWIR